jgi:transcription antitermination factor NusG
VDPKWYLVKTKALNENRVFTRLTGAGYEVIFPRFRKKSRRHRDVLDVRPLFPTYLFVLFPGDELKTIKYTHGVARVICFGLEPQEVGEEIIAAIRDRMDEEGFVKLEPKKVVLSPGGHLHRGAARPRARGPAPRRRFQLQADDREGRPRILTLHRSKHPKKAEEYLQRLI